MNIFLKKLRTNQQGFTLVEFIVIMAIFAIMVGVIMFNFTGFRSTVTLDNLAQDIALSLRHAQVAGGAGLSVNADKPEEETFRGIYFPVVGNVYDSKFILFQDTDHSQSYSGPEEDIDTVTIRTTDRISDILYGDRISTATNSIGYEPFTVMFGRYKTSAVFLYPAQSAGVVRIKLSSPDGSQNRFISISRIGQISVESI